MGKLPAASSRYYPKFSDDVSHELQHDARLTWDALYLLRNKTNEVEVIKLTEDKKISSDLTPGRPLVLILIQDSVGGRVVQWADKFKGANGIVLLTTANTYSTLMWYAVDEKTAYLMSGFTGGQL